MFRLIRQWWCGRKGHPFQTITVPIVGDRPGMPETDEVFCTNCGAHLYTDHTDNAGTERRDAESSHVRWWLTDGRGR